MSKSEAQFFNKKIVTYVEVGDKETKELTYLYA